MLLVAGDNRFDPGTGAIQVQAISNDGLRALILDTEGMKVLSVGDASVIASTSKAYRDVTAANFSLQLSAVADRSASSALQGQTVAGTIYVFVSPASGVTRVRFWLDNPQMSGTPRQTEGAAPWDFAGTAANGTANPTNTTTIPNGSHTITAAVDKSAGGTDVLSSTFTVGN